MSYFSF
ncbi:hypothetical protein VTH06DRAFT_1129 [Thermothelomyces fergusii]